MNKNYIENSLKRFLKRKVKITLGFVVAFMITGAVSFGAEQENIKENREIAKKYLTGYTQNNTFNAITGENFSISENGEITIKEFNLNSTGKIENIPNLFKNNINSTSKLIDKIYNENTNTEITKVENDIEINGKSNYQYGLELKDGDRISVITGESNNLQAAGSKKDILVNHGTIIYDGGSFAAQTSINIPNVKVYNYGIIKGNAKIGQLIKQEDTEVYNYGVIMNGANIAKSIGQQAQGNGAKAYNYGLIGNVDFGQATSVENVKLYNYGILASSIGQQVEKESAEGNNYGLIISKTIGQHVTKGRINNFGIIKSKSYGQSVERSGTAYNYSIIENDNIGQYSSGGTVFNYGVIKNTTGDGQYANNSHVYNYGIIMNKGNNGQHIHAGTGEAYNYGIIKNTGNFAIQVAKDAKDTAKGYNYGVVDFRENDTEYIFRGDVENRGLVFSTSDKLSDTGNGKLELGDFEEKNRGVVLNENLELVKTGKGEVNEHVINLSSNSIDGNDDKTYFVKNDTKEFDSDLTNNVLTAVITEKDNTTAFKYTGDDGLVLNNTSIIGYFEKNGTLLELNQDLTLEGNSVINAIAKDLGDTLDSVHAVRLAKNTKLVIGDNSKILGNIEGEGTILYENNKEKHFNTQKVDSVIIRTTTGETTDVALANLTLKDSGAGIQDAGKLIIDNQSDKKLDDKDFSTSITLANNINIEKGIDGSSSVKGIELILGDEQTSSDNTIDINGITLGKGDDTLIINNVGKFGEINGNDGDDTVNLKNSNGKHDTFDYNLKNIETLDLGNSAWKIGTNADITFGETAKADEKTKIQNGTLIGELQGNTEKAEFVNNNNVNNILGNSSFGENAKFQINIGKDMELIAGAEYDINDTTAENLKNTVGEKNIVVSGIFTKAEEQGKDIRVKTAEEMKIENNYSGIYEKMLENADKEEVLDILNNSSADDIAGMINGKGALGDTLSTTGYKITRDITNSFMSAVNEWDKKAGKGEWLANAKYINSDVEYDGANDVKGYDSDINSMVGMIEYGVSENTSYGIALGGGDTEIDVKGAGTLEGKNYYIGAYAKHSVNGFDLVGNLGYTISDLDVDDKGSADSSAVTVGGYVKRDISLTETVRIEPNFAFTYDYIMQDDAEGEGVKTDGKDIHVFEAAAGMNIVKGFNFEKGLLEIKAGAKYSMADTNLNEEPTVISLYDMENIELGNPDIDKTRGTAHVGFSYEHENGFGINGKYEMMWSDSGDDERVTAGISYRFN